MFIGSSNPNPNRLEKGQFARYSTLSRNQRLLGLDDVMKKHNTGMVQDPEQGCSRKDLLLIKEEKKHFNSTNCKAACYTANLAAIIISLLRKLEQQKEQKLVRICDNSREIWIRSVLSAIKQNAHAILVNR